MDLTIHIKPNSVEPWGEIDLGGHSVPLPYRVANEIIEIAMKHIGQRLDAPPRGSIAAAKLAALRTAIHSNDTYQGAAEQLGVSARGLRYMRKKHGL